MRLATKLAVAGLFAVLTLLIGGYRRIKSQNRMIAAQQATITRLTDVSILAAMREARAEGRIEGMNAKLDELERGVWERFDRVTNPIVLRARQRGLSPCESSINRGMRSESENSVRTLNPSDEQVCLTHIEYLYIYDAEDHLQMEYSLLSRAGRGTCGHARDQYFEEYRGRNLFCEGSRAVNYRRIQPLLKFP